MKGSFVKPMLLLRASDLPDDDGWLKELNLDGYRGLATKSDGEVQLRSRNDRYFTLRFPAIAKTLCKLPDETVLDGELVALDEAGRPPFNALQNFGSARGLLLFYLFDVLVYAGQDVMRKPLYARQRRTRNSGTHRQCGNEDAESASRHRKPPKRAFWDRGLTSPYQSFALISDRVHDPECGHDLFKVVWDSCRFDLCRMCREEIPGQQFFDPIVRVIGDAPQQLGHRSFLIDPVQLRRPGQTIDRCRALSAGIGPGETLLHWRWQGMKRFLQTLVALSHVEGSNSEAAGRPTKRIRRVRGGKTQSRSKTF